jgi:hypothetical protein
MGSDDPLLVPQVPQATQTTEMHPWDEYLAKQNPSLILLVDGAGLPQVRPHPLRFLACVIETLTMTQHRRLHLLPEDS